MYKLKKGNVEQLFVANKVLCNETGDVLDVSHVSHEDLLSHLWGVVGSNEFMTIVLDLMEADNVSKGFELGSEGASVAEEWEAFVKEECGNEAPVF